MVERKTRLRGAQVLDKSITAADLSGVGETIGFVATVQADETIAYEDTISLAGVNTNAINIVLNAFRIAIQGSLTQFNMVDGIVDEYEDESGIDTGASINELYDATDDFYSPSGGSSISASPFAHMLLEDNTDEGAGANAVTDIGTPTYTAGKLNNAFTGDGSTDALNLDALRTDIASDTTGSFSVWFNITAISGTGAIFMFGDTNANENIRMRINNGGIIDITQNVAGGTKWTHESVGALSTGIWYNMVLVQDGISPKIYLDGTDITNLVGTIDTTSWFSDGTGIDNGRLGCSNSASGGNTQFFNGQIDDFRYYKNAVLTQADVDLLYNSGTGTQDTNPSILPENMTLVSTVFTAEAQADNARIVLFEEDVDSITLNTDLKVYASRDNGTTFTQITLVNEGEYESGRNIISASVDISAQPAGTSMIYKIETLNNKDLKIHGIGLSWD